MVAASDVAALSLADSPGDVIAYACLVAAMCRGAGAAAAVEGRLKAALSDAPRQPPVVSSAGALVDALHSLGARRVAVNTPHPGRSHGRWPTPYAARVLTAATATARSILLALGLHPFIPARERRLPARTDRAAFANRLGVELSWRCLPRRSHSACPDPPRGFPAGAIRPNTDGFSAAPSRVFGLQ